MANRFDPGGGNQNGDELFEYIYREIWETLHNDSKMTLLALTQAGARASFDHLFAVSGLAEEAVDASP
ncbi:MAG: hypothetical protein IPM76_23085 [Chloroflexi bacterium]|nr:hypothetical protein [Chloroflexota bacterium]